MSEETPFKSLKITLSEEAIDKLAELKQGGAFRSDSATIEESIRVTYAIMEDFLSEISRGDKDKNGQLKPLSLELQAEMLRRVLLRVSRFGKNLRVP